MEQQRFAGQQAGTYGGHAFDLKADPNAMNRHGCNAAMWCVQGAGGVHHVNICGMSLGVRLIRLTERHGTVQRLHSAEMPLGQVAVVIWRCS